MQDLNLTFRKIVNERRKELTLIGVTILSTIILIVGFTYIPSTVGGDTSVPEEFVSARIRAGEAAERISDIADTYKDGVEQVADADRSGNYTLGLNLIIEEIEKNEEVRLTAEDLAEELNEMAKYMNVIGPEKAKTTALRAVTTGIELVQHLIGYNNYTRDLLNTLRVRLASGGNEETRLEIEQLIASMNAEADIINRLGSEYRGLMVQFDGLTE